LDQGPPVTNPSDARAKVLNEFTRSMPVKVAFWLKPSKDGPLYLVG
jgi:hypothetical protein